MIYLTFNDNISGIYKSQVVDVLFALNKIHNQEIKLVAFFSLRNYLSQKRQLKRLYPNSISLPMFPKLKNWQWNVFLLKFFTRDVEFICRGVFATNLAFMLSANRVVYDGRGAITEEFKEYKVGGNFSEKQVFKLEKKAVLSATFRIAVSSKLVEYWQKDFGYTADNHVIIPCTVSTNEIQKSKTINRKVLNFKEDDIVIVFTGGNGEWQSYDKMLTVLENYLISSSTIKVLLLCGSSDKIHFLQEKYHGRVVVKWVNFQDVQAYIDLADYGIVVRDQSVTNYVSSPVKIAEYLSCGLKILISPNIGDFSDFIIEENLGHLIDNKPLPKLNKSSQIDKNRIKSISFDFFNKKSNFIEKKFRYLLRKINT